MPTNAEPTDAPQFVIVYGPSHEKPVVYSTAYTPSEATNQRQLCVARYGPSVQARQIRADLLDPSNTKVRSVPELDA